MTEELAFTGKRIADRFELTTPAPYSFGTASTATWLANDTVLSRQVRAILIDRQHPNREATIDATRRSTLIEDTHTIAVLSVVDDAKDSVVFTELPLGTPLSAYLGQGPLDPESIASVMGQLASTIYNASHRGVRHLQLAANKIYITDAGETLVDGLGLSAALSGVDTNRLSSTLDREEARGLVVMLAALLLGKDFPKDPDSHDALIAKALELPNLPQSLTDLLEMENESRNVNSAGDFMRMIMPWGDVDFSALPDPRLPSVEELMTPEQNSPDHTGSDDAAITAVTETTSGSSNKGTNAANGEPELTETSVFAKAFAEENNLVEEAPLSTQPSWPSRNGKGEEADVVKESEGDEQGGDATHALPKLAWPKLPETVDSNASSLFEEPAPVKAPERKSILGMAENSASVPRKEPAAPKEASVPASSSITERKFNAPKAVFVIFGVLALIGLIFGISQLFKPLDPVSVTKPDTKDQKSTSQPGTSKQEEEKAKAEKEKEAQAQAAPPKIVKVTTVAQNPDFLANQDESTQRLVNTTGQTFDGNPQTAWQTWWYKNLATYTKNKVGLHVELEKETAVSEITVAVAGEGGNIQWVNAKQAAPTQGDVIASGAMSAQTVLKANKPVTTKEFVLWFDTLPVDKEGKLRAVINEISIK
ncbi:protein kinase family protein [Arcanobacterium ihumii]|uniref:hypothetical protein n=1 Tax=Arcanobacterium ihumii TaxID=2138162 RepID=UPI000F538800|nr:hypothetical protein [Arcanobacterium ihumii]